MTEKRFKINNGMDFNDKIETYELNCISDNDNETFYFIADSLENVQLFVKRLNELTEENEQLKQQFADVDRLIDDLGHDEMRRQYEEIFKEDFE